jgi:hypothetical protein
MSILMTNTENVVAGEDVSTKLFYPLLSYEHFFVVISFLTLNFKKKILFLQFKNKKKSEFLLSCV